MAAHVRQNRLGKIFMAETGFLLSRDPDTVRAPDIAFIRKDHLPAELPQDAFWPGPPDLAVEVVSPGDTLRELDEKVQGWLDAGAMLVWVVDPQRRSVGVYRAGRNIKMLTENDELTGEDVLEGFRCRVGEIFANP
jgi:Uma2 family endonuclease